MATRMNGNKTLCLSNATSLYVITKNVAAFVASSLQAGWFFLFFPFRKNIFDVLFQKSIIKVVYLPDCRHGNE